MNNKKWTITHSWTQPYPSYNNWSYVSDWIYHNESMMKAVEDKLASMERFPDAEKIIYKLRK